MPMIRMRALVLAVAGFSLGVAAVIQACGGTTSSGGDTDAGGEVTDAGNDVAPRDAGTDTGVDAGCDPTHDFTTDIPDADVPDTSTTTGICIGCLQAKCSTEIAACNKVCACQGEAEKGLTCYLKTPTDQVAILQCIGGIPSDITDLEAILGCANDSCPDECATSLFNDAGDDGGDSGM